MAETESARFPFVSLSKALDRTAQLFEADKGGKSVGVATAFAAWGYSIKSSGGFQTIAGLKLYGLVSDEGANEDRRIRLTDRARSYFLSEIEEQRKAMLPDFAFHTGLMRSLWNHWGVHVPPDNVARTYLKVERGLNEQSARTVLNIYKENLDYSVTKGGGTVSPSNEETPAQDAGGSGETGGEQKQTPGSTKPLANTDSGGRIAMASHEREIASGFLSKGAGFRLIVNGRIGVKELETLIRKIEIDKEILADADEDDDGSPTTLEQALG